jgi:signal transduction histidine kinase
MPKITISAIQKGEMYQFSIKDNGKGIPAEYFETIFEMFKRLHNDIDKSGSGIGLAICKKIVNAYNGKIWVKSHLGVGSTFYFTLPKAE